MSDLFKDILKDSETLFKDEIALDQDYIPKFIRFRESQQQYIAECIKPLFKKRSGKNLLITGMPGIGKTLAVKHILREMEEKGLDEEIFLINVNCWQKNTAHKIVLDICNQLNYKFTINKTTEQLIEEISKILNKKSAVIVLDEADKLNNETINILYTILEQIYRKLLILISNRKDFLSTLDQRIYSRLIPEVLEFKPYTENETFEILKQRVDYAFFPNTLNNEALTTISKKTFELKDIRVGLYLLKESANIAERKLKRKIEKQDAEEAIKKLPEFKIRSSDSLTEEQNNLLNIIKNNPGLSIKEINKIYNPEISYRTTLRKVKELEKLNLISIKQVNKGEGKKPYVFFGKEKDLSEF